MTEETNITSNSDERMLAALSHFLGLIVALIIWATQKDKSRFVRFQAVQALAFDLAVMLLMGILFFCLFGTMFIGMFGMMFTAVNNSTSPQNFSPFVMFPFMFPSLMFTCILPFSFAFLIAKIMAAVSVLNGNNFHYPFLGNQVEKFLADKNRT
jgi:uncharacterized Tic20 family protein